MFLSIKKNPLHIFLLPFRLMERRATLLQRLAQQVQIDWRTMPLRPAVVERMRAAFADNRRVLLLTAMPEIWAHALAAEMKTEAIIMDDTARERPIESIRSKLTSLFSPNGYDYIGGGEQDLGACETARRATLVTSDRGTISRANRIPSVDSLLPKGSAGFGMFMRMIRVHQWLKNFLIFVPLLAAHRLSSFDGIVTAIMAFLSFSFCASSVYILNDLLDLESDRQHIRKRNRPIAAGKIAVNQALISGFLLLVGAILLALHVSALFTLTLGIYFSMTLAYSLRLKRQVIVDVMLLAALYTIRVVAGAVATAVVPSFWLLALSMFLFLSLAVVKRYSEMLVTLAQEKQYAAGRGYSVADMPVLLSLGVSAGIAAIVVLALYINDPATSRLYPTTLLLWPVPPLMLYWISRVWMKTHRGEMHDDPVLFAMRDWQSLVTLVLIGSCFAAATIPR
jgi:4-hydroxybenzoate polyprenyltransferase